MACMARAAPVVRSSRGAAYKDGSTVSTAALLLYHGSRYSTVDHRTAHTCMHAADALACFVCGGGGVRFCLVGLVCLANLVCWSKTRKDSQRLSLSRPQRHARPTPTQEGRTDGASHRPTTTRVLSARAHTHTPCAQSLSLARLLQYVSHTSCECAYGMRRTLPSFSRRPRTSACTPERRPRSRRR